MSAFVLPDDGQCANVFSPLTLTASSCSHILFVVALNDALRENLFVVAIATLNRVPVFIVGKPGSSKVRDWRHDCIHGECFSRLVHLIHPCVCCSRCLFKFSPRIFVVAPRRRRSFANFRRSTLCPINARRCRKQTQFVSCMREQTLLVVIVINSSIINSCSLFL